MQNIWQNDRWFNLVASAKASLQFVKVIRPPFIRNKDRISVLGVFYFSDILSFNVQINSYNAYSFWLSYIKVYTRMKVRLHTAINRADFVSWCMLYT